MPPRDRRTADGVAVLLAGRWPAEVDAETGPRVSAAFFGRVWDTLCNATPADEPEDIATCGLSGVNEEQTENEAPEPAREPDGGGARALRHGDLARGAQC